METAAERKMTCSDFRLRYFKMLLELLLKNQGKYMLNSTTEGSITAVLQKITLGGGAEVLAGLDPWLTREKRHRKWLEALNEAQQDQVLEEYLSTFRTAWGLPEDFTFTGPEGKAARTIITRCCQTLADEEDHDQTDEDRLRQVEVAEAEAEDREREKLVEASRATGRADDDDGPAGQPNRRRRKLTK